MADMVSLILARGGGHCIHFAVDERRENLVDGSQTCLNELKEHCSPVVLSLYSFLYTDVLVLRVSEEALLKLNAPSSLPP